MKAILFDFDGTLVDSITPALKHVNDMLKERSQPPLTQDDYLQLRKLPYRQALDRLGISFWQVPTIALQIRKRLTQEIEHFRLYPGMNDMLNQLKASGYDLFILTSNTKKNVEQFLHTNHLSLFTDVFSEKNIFGKGITLGILMKKNGWKSQDIAYVGDEVRDIEAAQQNRVPVVSVTWGLQAEEVLSMHKPDYLAKTPADLLTWLTTR